MRAARGPEAALDDVPVGFRLRTSGALASGCALRPPGGGWKTDDAEALRSCRSRPPDTQSLR